MTTPDQTPAAPAAKRTGLLDKLPASWRHLALMGISYGLANGAHAITALHLTPAESGAAGIVLTWLTAYLTPLTRQYGLNK